jgi:hypothetical protein
LTPPGAFSAIDDLVTKKADFIGFHFRRPPVFSPPGTFLLDPPLDFGAEPKRMAFLVEMSGGGVIGFIGFVTACSPVQVVSFESAA